MLVRMARTASASEPSGATSITVICPAMVDEECVSLEDLESYEPGQEIDIEVAELKEGIEKKKKKRNYIEFRKDYEET
jgi:hypothetical protein